MKIRNCLITAAGLGTRMGILGTMLPKPLWPIYEIRLLDLQLEYIKRFNPERVFINAYHVCEKIKEWAKNKNVTILIEEELLGSGGCVHNLKKYLGNDQSGITCIVNSDQFFMLEEKNINDGIKLIESGFDQVIYGMCVDKSEKYNETYTQENKLVDIRKNKGTEDYYTYSGVCFINLEKLEYVGGVSSFFETVCNYKNNANIYFYKDTKNVEFWDFGEKQKYVASLLKMNSVKSGTFIELVKESRVVSERGYQTGNLITLMNGELEINLEKKEIVLNGVIDQF